MRTVLVLLELALGCSVTAPVIGQALAGAEVDAIAQQAYLKASNTGPLDIFGRSVAISGDTIVIGAPWEDSGANVVNGDQSNNDVFSAGAAYVFVRSGRTWQQQAYLKSHNPGKFDYFGTSVAVSGDRVIVRGRYSVYFFVRTGTTWSPDGYMDDFGDSGAVAISGNTAALTSPSLDRVHMFVRGLTSWNQGAVIQGVLTDSFGKSVGLSGDTLAVGAPLEDSASTGVGGDPANDEAPQSGAVYVYVRNGTTWTQQAYLKPSNTDAGDEFGSGVDVSGDTVLVGSIREDSDALGVDGNQSSDSGTDSGAAYAFVRTGTSWSQQAYLKASNTGPFDRFGEFVSLSGDTAVIGAITESSAATGVDGDGTNNDAPGSGAAYLFTRSGSTWLARAYLKASNTEPGNGLGGFDDLFGHVAASGTTVVVSADGEDSSATGVGGNQQDDLSLDSGAAYVFEIDEPIVAEYCISKPNSQGCSPTMGWSGAPSASEASPFLLTCSHVLNEKSGLLFYGSSAAAIPFQGATLCVLPPLQRTTLQNSMGNALPPLDCSGSYAFDINALIQSGQDPSLTVGEPVHAQYWGRDPQASFGTSLSNAVEFVILP